MIQYSTLCVAGKGLISHWDEEWQLMDLYEEPGWLLSGPYNYDWSYPVNKISYEVQCSGEVELHQPQCAPQNSHSQLYAR